MGEIKKQSIKGTIFIYSGAMLGFIISGFLFPRFLSTEQIGLIGVLVSYSAIFTQIASLGFVSATTRMFPYFRDSSKKHNGFVFLGNSVTFIGFVLVSIGFWFLEPYIITDGETTSNLLIQYSFLIYPLALFTVVFNFHDHYNKVLFNASRGLFLKEFVLRVVIIIMILLFIFKIIDFNQFVFYYVASYALPVLIIVLLLLKDKQLSYLPRKGLIDKDLIKPLISVSFFGIITSGASILTININRILVESYLGLADAGIFITCFFFGTMVILPSRAILKISSAYIADSFKKKNLQMIYDIYHKTSINQFAIGCLIFIGIWVNEKNIFEILGFDFLPGKWVIFFIGLAF
ncbi:MAG: oligosaccharide flippase family protein, partial [Bacteroidota bacterium]|nr:oligosaccharide flippase family protein [Bacteroidota bacterium]